MEEMTDMKQFKKELAKLPGKDWCWHKDEYPDGLTHVCTKPKGHTGEHDYLYYDNNKPEVK